MRLQEYITEDKEILIHDINELVTLLKKDCKKYLKLLKGRTPLFRGIRRTSSIVGLKKQRKDRRPQQMPESALHFIDDYLKDNKFPLRSESMICSSNIELIRRWFSSGRICFVFPKGTFRFAIVRSGDMNFDNEKTGYDNYELYDKIEDFLYTGAKDTYNEILLKLDLNIDGNSQKVFDEAYNKKYEMWFDCKEYYYVDISDPLSVIAKKL